MRYTATTLFCTYRVYPKKYGCTTKKKPFMVWLKGGAIFCYFVLLSAIFCYSGHLYFLVRLKEVLFCATFCYFLLFWGSQPHPFTYFLKMTRHERLGSEPNLPKVAICAWHCLSSFFIFFKKKKIILGVCMELFRGERGFRCNFAQLFAKVVKRIFFFSTEK